MNTAEQIGIPYNFEKITVSSVVKTLTPGTPPYGRAPSIAVLTTETDSIRLRLDGTAPTDAIGLLVAANSTVTVTGESAIKALKMIRVTSDATINVQYFY